MNAVPQTALRRSLLVALTLALGAAPHARAQGGCDNDCVGPIDVPEVSSTDLSPVAPTAVLLGGCMIVFHERRRKAVQASESPRG
jgi:hypothetical protein